MSEVIDRAKKALEGVAPGAWEVEEDRDVMSGSCSYSLPGIERFRDYRNDVYCGSDRALAVFIMDAHNTLIPDLVAELEATQRLLDDLTGSDIGEVTAHRDELWAERNALLQRNAALHAEVSRLGGGVR